MKQPILKFDGKVPAGWVDSPEAQACLRDLAGGPLALTQRWEGAGERRQIFSYFRAPKDAKETTSHHKSIVIHQLAILDLLECPGPNFDQMVLTPKGRALMDAKTEAA